MIVEAIALTDFVHGDINALTGRIVRHRDGSLIDQYTARDLEAAGLVRIRMSPVAARPAVRAGKPSDDGQGQPSSALPAAPASATLTSNASRTGGGRIRKAGE